MDGYHKLATYYSADCRPVHGDRRHLMVGATLLRGPRSVRGSTFRDVLRHLSGRKVVDIIGWPVQRKACIATKYGGYRIAQSYTLGKLTVYTEDVEEFPSSWSLYKYSWYLVKGHQVVSIGPDRLHTIPFDNFVVPLTDDEITEAGAFLVESKAYEQWPGNRSTYSGHVANKASYHGYPEILHEIHDFMVAADWLESRGVCLPPQILEHHARMENRYRDDAVANGTVTKGLRSMLKRVQSKSSER